MTIGGNDLHIVPSDVAAAIYKLGEPLLTLGGENTTGFDLFGVNFTSVSGLREMGQSHVGVLGDHGAESLRAFADRFSNIAAQLRQNLADVVNADTQLGVLMDAVGFRGDVADLLTGDHLADVVDTETSEFVITTPVVVRPGSLPGLASQFAATNYGVPTTMTSQWTAMSSKVAQAAGVLSGVLADLDSSSETQAIAYAMDTIRVLEAAGGVFAANTATMGTTTTNLGTAGLAVGEQVVMAAQAHGIIASTRPDMAPVFEQAYLTSFPSTMVASLGPSVPPLTQLLPSTRDPAGLAAGGMDGVLGQSAGARLAGWQDLPFPGVVQEAMEEIGMGQQARMRNPHELAEEFRRTGQDDLDALVAGHTPTTTATTGGGPSLPPTLTPGTTPAGATGVGAGVGPGSLGGAITSPAGGVPGVGSPYTSGGAATMIPGGSRGISGRAGAGNSAGSLAGHAAGGGHGGIVGGGRAYSGAHVGGHGGGAGSSGVGGAGRGGVGGSPGAGGHRGLGGQSGFGGHSGFGGNAGHSGGPGPNGAVGGRSGLGAGGASAASGGAGAYSRGAMPIGGMMGGGARGGSNSSPVRRVTSAVERKGNLKALLGEGPEVIPGVIGAWVREPRTNQ